MKVTDIISSDLIAAFWKQLSPAKRRYYSIRDNCGPCAIDFIDFAHEHGVELSRVRGYFRADEVVHDKADFTPSMKTEFRRSGLDWNNAADRKRWIEESPYADEWHEVPHYWCVDSNGNILDPSVNAQMIRTGMASDTNSSRYTAK